jgi:hypothetical protein
MTLKSLSDALGGDNPQIEALAKSLREDAKATPEAAVELLLGSDDVVASHARLLLVDLEALAIAPLVEASPTLPQQRAALIQQAVVAELALRRKVIARIDALLDDRTPIPIRVSRLAEQRPPPRRVCDEAYLLMRQMVHFGEPPLEAAVEADVFLNAPDGLKDPMIKKARASGVWNAAITGKDIDDYADAHPDLGTPPPPPDASAHLHPLKR